MKIVDVRVDEFRYESRIVKDAEGHAHPGDPSEATEALVTIITDEGAKGYSFGGSADVIQSIVRPALIGEDPFFREKIWQRLRSWQRLHQGRLSDKILSVVDEALWDLAGQVLGQPVYKLLGGFRTKVKAYGSTMVGDDMEGGLNSPEAYAEFAVKLVERGYKAIKLHTWMPPIVPEPCVKRDAAACRAVREAVGPDIVLMLDSYHNYSRLEALYLGRELEKLGFYWLEEPMNEHSISSYAWLADQLDIAVIGPETAEGKMQTRAEWIVRGASDISRCGVRDVGGITPFMKTAHLCEAFGITMEAHGNDLANLHCLCAMGIPGEYYERGLLHPMLDYDTPPPWLNQLVDPMDSEGYVHVSERPGLGWDINFDYIHDNLVRR